MVEEKGRQTADKKEGRKPWTLREFGGQTVWDWLHLLSALAIPVVLAAAGLWFTAQQDQRQQQIETDRAQQAQKIENQRAEAERKLAEQRAQDEALQAYLDQMSSLLLEKNLRESEEDSEVRILARARTLTALEGLDPIHERSVLQFLYEAKLSRIDAAPNGTGNFPDFDPAVNYGLISLEGAHLRNTDLSGAELGPVFIYPGEILPWLGIDLWRADLTAANLHEANLRVANLHEAKLRDANLNEADLRGANLTEADLRGAKLRGARLGSLIYSHVMSGIEATMTDADLRGANLREAQGITNKGLEQHTDLLEGATMPNGQKYEEWVKSRGEDAG